MSFKVDGSLECFEPLNKIPLKGAVGLHENYFEMDFIFVSDSEE